MSEQIDIKNLSLEEKKVVWEVIKEKMDIETLAKLLRMIEWGLTNEKILKFAVGKVPQNVIDIFSIGIDYARMELEALK